MAVSQSLALTQVSQSTANNNSVIRIKWTSTQSGASYNGYTKTAKYYVSVNGGAETEYSVSYTLPKDTTQTIVNTTLTVPHNDEGKCTVAVRTYMETGISAGTIQKSATLKLDDIPRASSLTAANGTLATKQTLRINRAVSTFKHRLTYNCGTAAGYIAGSASTYTTETSIDWTPPLSLASQNTEGLSVSVKLTLYTYTNDGTHIGTITKTITCAIPASVKPSCTVSLEDTTGLDVTYGAPVQSLSKIKITVKATTAYGSAIASYSINANGTKYAAATATTGALSDAGAFEVTATVKDKRGRSGTGSASMDVLAYALPKVSKLTVHRCDADGTENDQGEFVRVTFSAAVTDLNGLNPAKYTLKYKASTDPDYTEVEFGNLANVYAVIERSYIFPADGNKSYAVEVTAADNHGAMTRATSASTAFTLINWHPDGTGIRIGGVSEKPNTFQVSLDTEFDHPVSGKAYGLSTLPAIPENADVNDYLFPGCYCVRTNAIAETVSNLPIARAGRLIVSESTGAVESESNKYGFREQRFIPYDYAFGPRDNPAYIRYAYYDADVGWSIWPWWNEAIKAYPVGSIYLAYNHTDPAELFGGTWARISSYLLRGAAVGDTIGGTGTVATGSDQTYINISIWRRTA